MQELNSKKLIATYERVSSEDQRERQTIKTQTQELARRLEYEPGVELVERYVDDGISGKVPMAERPAGRRLLQDAARGRFEEVWVYKIDRLGRDDVDPLIVWRDLEHLGVKVHSVTEGVSSPFEYHIRVAMAAEERRTFLARSAAGIERAAREGRYCGGVRSYGYMIVGSRPVPSDAVIWGDWTAVDVVVWIYERLALDGWSCTRVAEDLNRKGVPTHSRSEGGGVRGKRTRGVWTAGRIRNLVIQPIYRGELQYGRRAKKPREVISARAEPLVSQELWDAAQETLKKNRLMAKNTDRVYLLRGIARCDLCGKKYSGSWTKRDGVRYRCNGCTMFRQLQAEKCPARSFRGSDLEPVIWADIERWLRNPGEILEELAAEQTGPSAAAICEAERTTLEAALAQRRAEKDRLLDAYQAGAVPLPELKPRMEAVDGQVRALELQLEELQAEAPRPEPVDEDLLAEIRRRLGDGLDDRQRQEIVSLLADIVMKTEIDGEGRKTLKAVVTYKFAVAADACTGRGSWRPPA